MAKVLVAYGSKMGGTEGIAARVADTLRGRGHEVTNMCDVGIADWSADAEIIRPIGREVRVAEVAQY